MIATRKSSVFSYRVVLSGAIVTLLAIVPMVGRAQDPVTRELIKPGPAEPRPRPVCGAIRPSETPTAANRDRARDASQRGQQAALLGDGATAIRVLREAATLDPTAADVAFQLAGVYETARDSVNAVKEYCRFLSLAPTSPEARTVVDKIRILAPPRIEQVIDLPLAVFRSGIAAYRRGELTTADSAFSAAIAGDTAWADAYYNRGRVRLLLGDRQRAGTDFAQYLRLNPEARDRLDVSNELATLGLGEYSFSPLQTLAWGILIPSAGEFYTHRPIRGILTLLGVGGSAAMAFQERTTGRRTEHPYLIAGLVTAGAVWLVSAVDATIYARNSVDKQRRVAFIVTPGTSGGLVAQVSLSR